MANIYSSDLPLAYKIKTIILYPAYLSFVITILNVFLLGYLLITIITFFVSISKNAKRVLKFKIRAFRLPSFKLLECCILICLFLFSFYLRSINTSNEFINWDDAEFATVANNLAHGSGGYLDTGSYYWLQPLFFMNLISISYGLFGVSENSALIVNTIIGSLTIFLVYFLSLALAKDKKIAIASSAIFAISPYHVLFSRILLLDAATLFFMMLSLIFFIKYIDCRKNLDIIFSSIFAGIALETKIYSGLLIAIMLAYMLLINHKKYHWRLKTFLYFALLYLFF